MHRSLSEMYFHFVVHADINTVIPNTNPNNVLSTKELKLIYLHFKFTIV